MKVKSESEVAQSCPTQGPHGLQPTRLLHPWDVPGKSTGVGYHRLLQWTPRSPQRDASGQCGRAGLGAGGTAGGFPDSTV